MKFRLSKRWLISGAAALAVAISLTYEFSNIITERESRLKEAALTADCGVVLTGSAGRIREAFEILGQKKIKKLVIAGVYKDTTLSQIFPHLPFYTEISADDVVLEKKSESTYGNAIQSLALVSALNCRDILLITSQLHMFRAHRIFADVYPKNIPITKVTVSNRKDFQVFDYLLETVKSSLYWVIGLVA